LKIQRLNLKYIFVGLHKNLKKMKTEIKNTLIKKMITASITLKPDKVDNFIEAAKPMIESSNAEAGCESYMFYQNPFVRTMFIAVEFWKVHNAIDIHNNSAHFKSFIKKTGTWQTEPAEIKVLGITSE
jgi:quinol monooxygenase YgiN